jgi:uncharacterized ferritin-like protein (DUF455 family)
MDNIYQLCFDALLENDVLKKCQKVHALANLKEYSVEHIDTIAIKTPGRPHKPKLVRFTQVPKRTRTDIGMISTIHAIAHIEFNAINLALDAAYRFQNIDRQFTKDWIRIASEEAKHFVLINNYLQTLGYEYGDFDAHNGLWKMTYETDYDPLVRMALVPRVLEARGLDATPGIMKKFQKSQFREMVDILQVIFDDEIGHVKVGNYWYKYLCDERNLDYMHTFDILCKKHIGDNLRGPFNTIARLKAGFSRQELDFLELHKRN